MTMQEVVEAGRMGRMRGRARVSRLFEVEDPRFAKRAGEVYSSYSR